MTKKYVYINNLSDREYKTLHTISCHIVCNTVVKLSTLHSLLCTNLIYFVEVPMLLSSERPLFGD